MKAVLILLTLCGQPAMLINVDSEVVAAGSLEELIRTPEIVEHINDNIKSDNAEHYQREIADSLGLVCT